MEDRNYFKKDSKIPVWIKVTVPTVASLILFLVVIFLVHLPAVHETMLEQKKNSLRDVMQIVFSSLEYLRDQEKRGILTNSEARKKGIALVRRIRFGMDSKDYFWINNMDSEMIMHPYMLELEGRDLTNFTDFKGNYIIRKMVDIVRAKGEGFIPYYWQWQDKSDKIIPKISYVKRFEPWDWVIGTGIYLDDVEQAAAVRYRELIMITSGLLALIITFSLYIILQSRAVGRQIRESEALFKGIFNFRQQFSGVLSPEGILLRANKSSLDFVQVDEKEVVGKYFWDTAWWEQDIEVRQALKQIIHKGSNGESGRLIFEHISPAGDKIFVDFSINPIFGAHGEVEFLIAEGHDITELKNAQSKIAYSEALFKGVFNQSLQLMGVIGEDGRLLEVNRVALDFVGVKPENVIGRYFWNCPWWDSSSITSHEMEEDIKSALGGHIVHREVYHYFEDGEKAYFDFSLKPVFDTSGDLAFLLAEGRNFTELRETQDLLSSLNRDLENKVEERTQELKNSVDRLEKTQAQLIQAEKMAALGGLVAGVAHEINTPVGISVTSISYMEERLEDIVKKMQEGSLRKSDLDKFLKICREATKSSMLNLHRAAELIGNFKMVAADQASGQRRIINLANYIDEILLSLRSKYKRTKHEISVNCPPDLLLNTYPGAFMQIFSNLIINSLIHGFEGIETGHISIAAKLTAENVSLRYADDGQGMDAGELAKIFEPFFTTKRGAGGTGLGMSIVYNIVTSQLGGSISCTSEKGEGIAFTLLLPLEIVVDNQSS